MKRVMTKKSTKKIGHSTADLFTIELQRCLLLNDEDKGYFLENAKFIPEGMLKLMYELVHTKNALVEKYIRLALAEDKDHLYLSELKAKIRKLKMQSKKIMEEGEQSGVESELLKKLSEI